MVLVSSQETEGRKGFIVPSLESSFRRKTTVFQLSAIQISPSTESGRVCSLQLPMRQRRQGKIGALIAEVLILLKVTIRPYKPP